MQDTMFRAVAVLRVVVLVNTLVLYAARQHGYEHRGAGAAVMVALVLWTAVMAWAYSDSRRRVPVLLVADLAVAVTAILLSPYVKGAGMKATLPGFWVMAAVLAWAVLWGWGGGLAAAACVSLVDISVRGTLSQQTYGYIFLLLLGGAIVGFLSRLLQETTAARDRAERVAAAAEERQRLARVVHDGVLQVLALVQRRAPELGEQGAELARLAGEQETRLRALVQQGADPELERAGALDLSGLLGALESRTVHVAGPGSVPLRAAAAHELLDAVEACLSNVRHHVGGDADAWILLEDLGDRVVVSVRDEGPGIPEGRLLEAARAGRLGVQQSIVGRVQDLGGAASLRSVPGQGTEWELSVPRKAT